MDFRFRSPTLADLHEYLGGPNICPTTPHPITGTSVPLTFGHEFSGIVEEIGEGVSKFKEGDRVCVEPIIWDGTCGACKDGFHNCCDKGGFVGLSGETSRSSNIILRALMIVGWGGGLSEHCVVPETSLYRLPEQVSLQVGGMQTQHNS